MGQVTVIEDAMRGDDHARSRHRAQPQVDERAVLVRVAQGRRREHERGDRSEQRQAEVVDEAAARELMVDEIRRADGHRR